MTERSRTGSQEVTLGKSSKVTIGVALALAALVLSISIAALNRVWAFSDSVNARLAVQTRDLAVVGSHIDEIRRTGTESKSLLKSIEQTMVKTTLDVEHRLSALEAEHSEIKEDLKTLQADLRVLQKK